MKFQCQESCGGACCKTPWGEGHFVFLTKKDQESISAFTKKPLQEFANKGEFAATRFTMKKSVQWFLKDKDNACMFFKDGKCSIYKVRPVQCRTFPFWPELMVNYKYEKLKSICPGIGQGSEQTHHLLAEQVKADDELKRNK